VATQNARIVTERRGPVVRVALRGEVDLADRPDLVRTFEDVLALETIDQVIVDMRAAEFIDSTTLGVLVMANTRARRLGIRVAFVKGPPAAHRPFELTCIDQHLNFVELPPGE
jgi:anti-anti-sigma factor